MRDIKFRAWDNLNKKWLLGYEYKNLGGFSLTGECVLLGEWGNVFDTFLFNKDGKKWGDLKIMQFTGLKDKNGVDIYDGDVLEFKNDLGKHKLHKIFYKNGGLCFNIHKDDFYKNPDEIYFYEACADMQSKGWIIQCEVIGNIHENKELINK